MRTFVLDSFSHALVALRLWKDYEPHQLILEGVRKNRTDRIQALCASIDVIARELDELGVNTGAIRAEALRLAKEAEKSRSKRPTLRLVGKDEQE